MECQPKQPHEEWWGWAPKEWSTCALAALLKAGGANSSNINMNSGGANMGSNQGGGRNPKERTDAALFKAELQAALAAMLAVPLRARHPLSAEEQQREAPNELQHTAPAAFAQGAASVLTMHAADRDARDVGTVGDADGGGGKGKWNIATRTMLMQLTKELSVAAGSLSNGNGAGVDGVAMLKQATEWLVQRSFSGRKVVARGVLPVSPPDVSSPTVAIVNYATILKASIDRMY
jgi:hypothetical protein